MSAGSWKVPVLTTGGAAGLGLKTNLVAWWELDEASGNRADSHTNGLTLTDNNAVTSASGVGGVGTAAEFAVASNQFLSRADNALLDMGDIDFTFALWIYRGVAAVCGILTKNDLYLSNSREYEIDYWNVPDRIQFSVSPDGTPGALVTVNADALGSPSLSTWYFVVAQHDSVNNLISIQINNGTRNTVSHSGGVYAGTSALNIGAHVGGNYMNGRIAKVGIWKSAAGNGGVLTAAQLTSLYNAGAGRTYSEL